MKVSRGGTSRGTPTSRSSASRTSRLGISASCTPGLRTRHPSATLCPRSRHPRHAPAPLDPSASRRPGTSQPPTGCAPSPRSSYLLPSTHSLLLCTSLPFPGARQDTVPGSPGDTARCRHSRARASPICAEPPLLSPEPEPEPESGKKEAKDQREYPVLPSSKPTSPRGSKGTGAGRAAGSLHCAVGGKNLLISSLPQPDAPHNTVSLIQGSRAASPSSTSPLTGLESNQLFCFPPLSSVGHLGGT